MRATFRPGCGLTTCAARSKSARQPRGATASCWMRWPKSAVGIWVPSLRNGRGHADAFRRAGIDVDSRDRAEAAVLLPRPARRGGAPRADLSRHLVASLGVPMSNRRAVAAALLWPALPTPTTIATASALVERPDIRKQGAALRALSQDRKVAELPPASILQLRPPRPIHAGDQAGAVSLLESAAQRYTDDVWINYSLAQALAELPTRREDAVRYYTARALRPESAHNLGHLLDQMGRGERHRNSRAGQIAAYGGPERRVFGHDPFGSTASAAGLKTPRPKAIAPWRRERSTPPGLATPGRPSPGTARGCGKIRISDMPAPPSVLD